MFLFDIGKKVVKLDVTGEFVDKFIKTGIKASNIMTVNIQQIRQVNKRHIPIQFPYLKNKFVYIYLFENLIIM